MQEDHKENVKKHKEYVNKLEGNYKAALAEK